MTRHILSASFLLLGCALTMSLSSAQAESYSEPEIHFYPAKIWNTLSTPVTSAGVTTKKCTITNEFNNGFIVQLSGSHKWVEALQIDFRQDAFDPGQNYNVALSVPGLKNKALSGKAANSNQLVIGMTGQKDMYQAMRDSSVFDLKIDENEFRFYMVGFAANAEGFERCMAGGDIEPSKRNDFENADASAPKTPTFNEAIAYEQAEKFGVEITEVLPNRPEPMLGDIQTLDATELTLDTPESETEKLLAEAPLAVRAAKQGGNKDYKRLSDTIAEEILNNPDIAALDRVSPAPVLNTASPLPAIVVEHVEEGVAETALEVETIEWAAEAPDVAPEVDNIVEAVEASEIIEAAGAPEDLTQPPTESAPVRMAVAVADPSTGRSGRLVMPPNFDTRRKLPPPPTAPSEDGAEAEDVSAGLRTAKVKKPAIEIEPPVAESEIVEKIVRVAPAMMPEIVVEKDIETPIAKAPEKLEIPEGAKIKVTKRTGSIEADFTDEYVAADETEPAASKPQASTPPDHEMARKVSELERKLHQLEKENMALNADLEDTLKDSKKEQLSISSENWNLERASQRFDEAERQLKRLGQQLQQERTACNLEKQELEAMLFDPSLTADAQMAKLSQMRRELSDTKEQLRAALKGR